MSAEIKKILALSPNVDKKTADFLSNALLKGKQNGFDYLKFKQSLNQIAKLNLDEGTTLQSAYATASTIGITKASLISSAKHYLNVLMHEKSQFDSALNKQVKERIASKKEEVVKLEQRIQELKAKIKEIEKKVTEYQHRIDNSDSEVEKAKQKILATKTKFEKSFEVFVNIIEGDIQKIEQYL
jgi:chromosome segregation ATPase